MQDLEKEPKESLTIDDILMAFKECETEEEVVNDSDIDALFNIQRV